MVKLSKSLRGLAIIGTFLTLASIAWLYHNFSLARCPVDVDDERNEDRSTSWSRRSTAKLPLVQPNLPPAGIGFDLATSYGTAVITYPNGTTSLLARVLATPAYSSTLHNLSLPSSQHFTPPYNSWGEWAADKPRQEHRKARKTRGLPASKDVGALSSLISDLRARVGEKLGHNVTEVVAATPNLLALYDEDIADAFEYLELGFIRLPYWQHLFKRTGAAYAGYGFGLCKDYMDVQGCWEEQKAMPIETVMAVTFTRDALMVTLSSVQSVLWLWEPQYRTHLDWGLGLDVLREGRLEEVDYWKQVKEGLLWVMHDRPGFPKPVKALLTGECAEDGRFLGVLTEALMEVMDHVPGIYKESAEYVVAKGAAELAKRAPYDWRLLFAEEIASQSDDVAERTRRAQGTDRRNGGAEDSLLDIMLNDAAEL